MSGIPSPFQELQLTSYGCLQVTTTGQATVGAEVTRLPLSAAEATAVAAHLQGVGVAIAGQLPVPHAPLHIHPMVGVAVHLTST